MAFLQLSQTLADSFNALANEVQSLADRKTVLEHKLRFAHEEFQYLADKYAPAAPEIAETLTKLQLPPHTSLDSSAPVPLPPRASSPTPPSQHQIALLIRDGRRAASRLASLGDASKTTASSRDTFSPTSEEASSMSTALEQDFTVQGKKGNLQCPFSKTATQDGASAEDAGTHDPEDPICAAMDDEAPESSASAPGKCPIRFLDKHSPEEVARYVEMNKHNLPRSHEVCLRRYQRNEEQVRKLDSKYGNIANMIEDLGQLHQSMLPEAEQNLPQSELDGASNKRVENWAQDVSVSTDPHVNETASDRQDDERQSHFDRPLKEVRVGESPSRPWGISIPIYDTTGSEPNHILSPPPAPVRMPSPHHETTMPKPSGGKCPFDHTKMPGFAAAQAHAPKAEPRNQPGLHGPPPITPTQEQASRPPPQQVGQPVFVNPDAIKAQGNAQPQMVFTGPVFIGYPMDQALQFMNQFQRNQ